MYKGSKLQNTKLFNDHFSYLSHCVFSIFCKLSSQLKEQLAELREKLSRTENESTVSVSKLQDVIQGLKERLKSLEKEKERALRDKENLMDEVSSELHVEYQIDVHLDSIKLLTTSKNIQRVLSRFIYTKGKRTFYGPPTKLRKGIVTAT